MKLVFPSLYAIMDAVLLGMPEPAGKSGPARHGGLAFAEMLAESGVELIQYRNKTASSRSLLESCRGLVNLLSPRGVRIIVNDRADVAVLAGADGVHVGQEDLTVEQARAVCGPGRWVGVSTHTLGQVERAASTSADYIAVGPIFPTQSKENSDPVVGIDFIRRARPLTAKPLVAIGGITLERVEEVYAAGADSVAVARDLSAAPDPAERARQYLVLGARSNLRARGALTR
jgi:thiamine-phosphate pyrophosphorylase